jgi:hypothetical protein
MDRRSETCPVCLDGFSVRGEIAVLPCCAHVYHDECIRKWSEVTNRM